MKHVIVDGLDIAYDSSGTGKHVLLVHGWGSNMQTYDQLSELLAKKFHVMRLDLPGFGGSQTPKKGWSLDDYALFLDSFLKKMDSLPLHGLIGHSLGGRIALRAQATAHLNSEKLVLLASHGIASPHSPRIMFYKVLAKLGKALSYVLPTSMRKSLRERLYQRAGSTDYANTAPAMKETFQNIIGQDLRDDVTKIQTDALLIYGTKDTMTPPKFGEIFANRMPHARLELIDGAGHYVHLDNFSRVSALIGSFL